RKRRSKSHVDVRGNLLVEPVSKLTGSAPSARRALHRAQLALGRLRSAKPRLGEAWRDGSLGRRPPERRPGGRAAGPPGGELAETVERDPGIFFGTRRVGHEGAGVALQLVHQRVRMGPAIAEARTVELA